MNLRERLSDRIHIEEIHEISQYVQGNLKRKSELYGLIFDPDETIGYQALWACSHFPQMRINGYTINKMN